MFHVIARLVQLRAGSGQIKDDQTMAALWGKMRFHLQNMKLHSDLDISATYLTYMEKQIKSSNTKITTMISRSYGLGEAPEAKQEPDDPPARQRAAKSNAFKRPAAKAVKKVHTKK